MNNSESFAKQEQFILLEKSLWQQLKESSTIESFAQAWLNLQCLTIKDVQQAIVILRTEHITTYAPIAQWPENGEISADLTSAAELVIQQQRGIIRKLDQKTNPAANKLTAILAYPVLIDNTLHGIVAMLISASDESVFSTVMRQLQWGVAGIRERLHEDFAQSQKQIVEQTTLALNLLSVVLDQEGFQASCRTAITELASNLDCERVSIGFLKRGYSKVISVSHSAEFGKNMNLVQMLGIAMDEAIDQRAILRYPANKTDEPMVMRAHQELAQTHGAGTILSIPILMRDTYIGAFTYERLADMPFDQSIIDRLTGISTLLGPVLHEKQQNDRWLITKAAESIKQQVTRLLGPGFITRKLVILTSAVLLICAYLITAEYRVAADARIEGYIQRSLIAPFDGYIREASVRAGETVKQGIILAALDDRDLALSRLKQVTDRAQNQHRFEEALSARDRSKTNIIKTEIQKADAQIALIDEQLARAKIVAPFSGIVVAGDLSQNIGGAVRRGEVLFEMAPLNEYRVIIQVDEAQITDIEIGQQGELLTTALPNTPFAMQITRITSVAETFDGRNTFQVEAELEKISTHLRPGMQGVGKINIGQRRLVWIWSRTLIDWFTIWSWRWFS